MSWLCLWKCKTPTCASCKTNSSGLSSDLWVSLFFLGTLVINVLSHQGSAHYPPEKMWRVQVFACQNTCAAMQDTGHCSELLSSLTWNGKSKCLWSKRKKTRLIWCDTMFTGHCVLLSWKKVSMHQRHLAHLRSQLATAWQSQLGVTQPERRESRASGDLLYEKR